MERIVILLAGGSGERFWPQSRREHPKQFQPLLQDGGETLLQITAKRNLPLAGSWERLCVVTTTAYAPFVREQLPLLPAENLFDEPVTKSTAPGAGHAAAVLSRRYPDAVLLILPCDHFIRDEEEYRRVLDAAATAAETEGLCVIGIPPTYPETGYGYIRAGERLSGEAEIYRCESFTEKPDKATAKAWLEQGGYYWNAGMLVCRCSVLLEQLKLLLPEVYGGVMAVADAWGTPRYRAALAEVFDSLPMQTLDYGILERTCGVRVFPGRFGWDDIGSWNALERVIPPDGEGNLLRGEIAAIRTEGCTVLARDRLIAAVGLRGLVIVDTPDALLVCDKEHMGELRTLPELIETMGLTDLL